MQFFRNRNATFLIGKSQFDSYVFGIFADHRTVHFGACRVIDIGRTDDRLVVRSNAYRDKRAVDAEIARGRILDIALDRVNAVGFGELFAGICVVQTGFGKAGFELFRKRRANFLQGTVVKFRHRRVKRFVQHDLRFVDRGKAEGKGRRQCDIAVVLAAVDHAGIGFGFVRAILNGKRVRVRRGPRNKRPGFAVDDGRKRDVFGERRGRIECRTG